MRGRLTKLTVCYARSYYLDNHEDYTIQVNLFDQPQNQPDAGQTILCDTLCSLAKVK